MSRKQVERWITYMVYAVLLFILGEIFNPDVAMYAGLAWIINDLSWKS